VGRYRRYFRPVYLDENAIEVARGTPSDDVVAQAIVELHKTFDQHYETDLASRHFLSLNDIEAFLALRGGVGPLPPADKVISVWRSSDNHENPTFAMHSDTSDYWPEIKKALAAVPEQDAISRFDKYLQLVTAHSGSYHHVTIGSDKNWAGRAYLAFRAGEAHPFDQAWINGIKNFAFEVLTPMALAGTFVRNPDIIEMLGDVRQLMLDSQRIRRRHHATFDQFAGSAARTNRKTFHTVDPVDTVTLARLKDHEHHGFHKVRAHIATPGLSCHCQTLTEPLTHALANCDLAGAAFLADLSTILATIGTFTELPEETVAHLVNALAFGLTGHEERPKTLTGYFNGEEIENRWVITCRTDERLDQCVPGDAQPFLRALLLMAGNAPMVKSNAERLGVTLGSGPELSILEVRSGRVVVGLKYKVSGDLKTGGSRDIELPRAATLHKRKNWLLVHFGKHFFDDFHMYVSTTVQDKTLVAKYQWSDVADIEAGTISYGFSFSQ